MWVRGFVEPSGRTTRAYFKPRWLTQRYFWSVFHNKLYYKGVTKVFVHCHGVPLASGTVEIASKKMSKMDSTHCQHHQHCQRSSSDLTGFSSDTSPDTSAWTTCQWMEGCEIDLSLTVTK